MCNVLNCPIFSTNRISFAENHPLMRSTKFESISFRILRNIWKLLRVLLQIKIILQKHLYFRKRFSENCNKNAF